MRGRERTRMPASITKQIYLYLFEFSWGNFNNCATIFLGWIKKIVMILKVFKATLISVLLFSLFKNIVYKFSNSISFVIKNYLTITTFLHFEFLLYCVCKWKFALTIGELEDMAGFSFESD